MRHGFKRHQATLGGSMFAGTESQSRVQLQHQPIKTGQIRHMGRADQKPLSDPLFRKSLHGAREPPFRFHRRDVQFGLGDARHQRRQSQRAFQNILPRACFTHTFHAPGIARLIAKIGDRAADLLQSGFKEGQGFLTQPINAERFKRFRAAAGKRARAIRAGGAHQAFSTKRSIRRLSPALSKRTSNRSSSTPVTSP